MMGMFAFRKGKVKSKAQLELGISAKHLADWPLGDPIHALFDLQKMAVLT